MKIKCIECKNVFDVPAKPEDIDCWNSGGLIQNVMPYLSEADRELLISQICGECFDAMFEGADDLGDEESNDEKAPAF